MPYPIEYVRASDFFQNYLTDARDAADFGSSHQAYTMTQAVFQAFRQRLSIADAIKFAQILPVCLKAMFITDWNTSSPEKSLGTKEDILKDIRALRPDHNFSPDYSVEAVKEALLKHIDNNQFQQILSELPEKASDFWQM